MHNPTFASRVVQSIVLVFLYGVQADSIKAQVEIEDRLNSIEKCRSIIASAQRKLAEELLNLDKESDALQKLVPEASISRDHMGYAFTEEIAKKIEQLFSDDKLYLHYKNNTQKAAAVLNWQNECRVLEKIYL